MFVREDEKEAGGHQFSAERIAGKTLQGARAKEQPLRAPYSKLAKAIMQQAPVPCLYSSLPLSSSS